MKLTAKEDVEAPISYVYAALTDFGVWEGAAMRRGAEVERLDRLRKPGPGMEWQVGFIYRGKKREVTLKLLSMALDQTLSFGGTAQPAEAVLKLDLAEMGPRRTRVLVNLEIKPQTLAARLFVQSLRLAKAKVTRRFSMRLNQIGKDIEDRYRAPAMGLRGKGQSISQ
jgi:hypothetical protein